MKNCSSLVAKPALIRKDNLPYYPEAMKQPAQCC